MRMFLRKSASTREPLPLAMSGVRMGERLVQIGFTDARLWTMLASKPGISGRSAVVVRDDRDAIRAQSAAANEGVLLEVHVSRDRFPFDDGSFDVAIVHGTDNSLATLDQSARVALLAECHRALRVGGRVIVLEPGTREGIAAWFRSSSPPKDAGGGIADLEGARFAAVRLLADREGYRFTEGLKR
jgi:SAM-dependent methyltransferase